MHWAAGEVVPGSSRVAAKTDIVWAVQFEVSVTATGVAGQDSGPRLTMGERVMGSVMGMGEGKFRGRGFLPSIRAPVILAARVDRSQKKGLRTSKGGALGWLFVSERDPSPWAE